VKTGHENIGGPGHVINDFGPHPDDIGWSGIRKKVFIALAGYSAAITGNALLLVLIKIIDAHDLLPSASMIAVQISLSRDYFYINTRFTEKAK
jgi:hypothetical protein